MKRITLFFLVLALSMVVGCAFLEKVAPPQIDEQGVTVPGTHQLTPLAQDVAGAIPYGGVATTVMLLIWNFFEVEKARKTSTGLMATIRAIEVASKDPEIKDAIEKLKVQLAAAHQSANVQPLINRLLAQLKFKI